MLIETSAFAISNETLAGALAKGVKYAKLAWLENITVHAMQARPAAGVPAYADPACIAKPFLFRASLKGDMTHGKYFALDNARLAKGVAKLAAVNPQAFGRIMANKGTVADCISLLQFALFDRERF
jgi:hypothetical protein